MISQGRYRVRGVCLLSHRRQQEHARDLPAEHDDAPGDCARGNQAEVARAIEE